MIISDINRPGRAAAVAGRAIRWSCLARRGMLHSECEAVDHLELPPGAVVTMDGRSGTEEAWYVLDGTAEVTDPTTSRSRRVGTGFLVLRPAQAAPEIRNRSADLPLRLLLISVLPRPVTDRLPARSPVAEEAIR